MTVYYDTVRYMTESYKQAEAEVVPSSSLVEVGFEDEVGVEVEVGVEFWV